MVEEVLWQNEANVIASNLGFTKSGSTGWDAGAFSRNPVYNRGYVETIINETNTRRMFGLNNSDASSSYTDIDYAVYLISNGTMAVFENGSNIGSFGSYSTNDTIRVQLIESTINYIKNGQVFYTSSVAPTLPLRVDMSLYDNGASLENITIGNQADNTCLATISGFGGIGASYQWKLNGSNVGSNSNTYVNNSLSAGDSVQCVFTPGLFGCGVGSVTSNFIAIEEIIVEDNIRFSITNDSLQSSTCLYADEEIAWETSSSLEINGNNVTKVGSSGWDGGAFSYSKVGEGGFAQTVVNEINTSRMFGLNASNSGISYSDIDYAIFLVNNGSLRVYENGSNIGTFGSYSSGDTLRVQVIDNKVKYLKNGQEFYASLVSPSLPLKVDLSIATIGGTVEDIRVNNGVYGRFIANVTGAGASPSFQWKLNSGNVGSNSPIYTNTSLSDGDVLSCDITADYINCSNTVISSNSIDINEISVSDNITFSITNDSLQSGTCLYADEEIAWEVTSSLDINGSNVTKIGGNGWDGGAFSFSSIGEGGFAQTIVNETNKSRMFGLNAVNVNSSYTDIDYAVYLVNNGSMNVYENGSSKGTFGGYSSGDTIRVQVIDNEVKYIKNGQTFYTSSVTPSLPLKVDLSINHLGGTFEDILVSSGAYGRFRAHASGAGASPSYQWKLNGSNVGSNSTTYLNTSLSDADVVSCELTADYINCSGTVLQSNEITINEISVSDNITFSITSDSLQIGTCLYAEEEIAWEITSSLEISGKNVTKIGGNGWDGGAFSYSSVGEGGFALTIINETNKSRMFGLNSVNTTSSYNDIDYAVYLVNNGTMAVYENGSNKGSFGGYSSGDTIKVQVIDNEVKYIKNGQTFYTSSVTPSLPLKVDLSINHLGGTFENILVSSGVYGRFKAYASGAGASPTYQWKLNNGNVGSNSSTYTNTTLTDGDVVQCEITPDYINCSASTVTSNSISISQIPIADNITFSITNDSLQNGACLLAEEEISWELTTSLEVSGNNVTKIGGNGWDGAAFSNSKVGEGGYAQTIVNETNSSRMFGLNAVNGGSSYNDIDYAVYLINNGNVNVYENGSNRGTFTAYSSGDTLRVQVVDNTILYLKNSQVFYTSLITPNLPLKVDLSINNLGGTLEAISASAGTYGRFLANATGAGASPSFQWKLNGGNVGSNSTTYTNTSLSPGDVITCELTADYVNCVGSVFTSNQIVVSNSAHSYAYSISSGNWSNPATWSCGKVPSDITDVYIESGHIVSLTADAVVDDLNIDGSLTFTGNQVLTINGNIVKNGSLNSNAGTLNFNGSDVQNINSVDSLKVYDLTIDNAAGVSVSSGEVTLSGTLDLVTGTFNTNNALTIESTIAGTGRIGSIPASGTGISGDITVQRYIEAGATNWRFLSSAVSGADLSQLNDDFITSGFTGSDFPSFGFTSIQTYNESTPGSSGNGFEPATNATNPMNTGQGFYVWCGDTITGTLPFIIDFIGPANTGTISLPVTYTNDVGQPASEDGWNLIGNPYPSSIDWDDANWTKTNVNNAIYIWDTDANQYASYVAGVGANGGTNIIASSQAFWIQTNANSPVLTAREAVKSTVDQPFLRKEKGREKLSIRFVGNNNADEMVFSLHESATTEFDQNFDAGKIFSSNGNVPSICSVLDDQFYSINTIERPKEDFSMSLFTKVPVLGEYELIIDNELNASDYSCIFLEDVLADTSIDLSVNSTYKVRITNLIDSTRFVLHLGAKWAESISDISCYGEMDGQIEVQPNGPGPWTYHLKDSLGSSLDYLQNSTKPYTNKGLDVGIHGLLVENAGLCGSSEQTYVIQQPVEISAKFESSVDKEVVYVNQEVEFNNSSVNAKKYLWEFGDGTQSGEVNPIHAYSDTGNYTVVLNAINDDCSVQSSEIVQIVGIESPALEEVYKVYSYEDKIYVQLVFDKSTQLKVELVDVLGKLIFNKSYGKVKSLNEEIHPLGGQSIYFVRMYIDGEESTEKVLLSK